MNARDHADEQWDVNLRSMAETMDIPAAAPRELRERCVAVLKGDIKVKNHQRSWRTAVFSTVGIAAAIVVLFGFFGFPHGQTEVNAAVILRTLNEQVQTSQGVLITIDSLVLDGVSVDGRIQICAEGVAGDIKVDVEAADKRPSVVVDATLGIKPGSGWLLLRELELGDPQMQAIARMFVPAGRKTLITLPMEEDDFNISTEIGELRDHEFSQLIDALIGIHEEVGATIENQPDGTILLTLPIKDTQTLEALSRLEGLARGEEAKIEVGVGSNGMAVRFRSQASEAEQEDVEPDIHEHMHEHFHKHHAESDHSELVGATVKVLYSPSEGAIRWFKIEDFGEENGTIGISFDAGPMDASRLDKESVMDESVHVVDLAALKAMFGDDDEEAKDDDLDE